MNVAISTSSSAAKPATYRKNAVPTPPPPVHVRFQGFELDEQNALLLRDGHAVMLAPRPFGVLCALARHPGQLQTKNTLLDDVWGHQFDCCVADWLGTLSADGASQKLRSEARDGLWRQPVERDVSRGVLPPLKIALDVALVAAMPSGRVLLPEELVDQLPECTTSVGSRRHVEAVTEIGLDLLRPEVRVGLALERATARFLATYAHHYAIPGLAVRTNLFSIVATVEQAWDLSPISVPRVSHRRFANQYK